MCCDLVYASDDATFEWAYGKTGLTGAESATFLLPRLIGLRATMELVFLNPRLDAEAALGRGLITGILPRATFQDALLGIARRAASASTPALAGAKALLNEATGLDRIDLHLAKELRQLTRIADSPDFAEGLSAFFEKREPAFAGTGKETP
jgi:2-(1,2-epoxy-1,2-dihydrophenyl)acetyl-CoA isomerase